MKRVTVLVLALFATTLSAQRRAPLPYSNDPWVYSNSGPNTWDNSWNGRPNPRRGACFYADPRYSGNHFCVRRGDRLSSLPGNFGDHISSVQLFGTRARIFNDRNFSGGSRTLQGSVADLRRLRFRNKSWNDRISSVMVF